EVFCRKLTKLGHESGELPKDWEFRLPTEAQWEYACRAGTKTAYWTGDNDGSLAGNANVADLSFWDKFPQRNDASDFRDNFVFTSPVDRFKANPWGLHDVHGNAGQWCEDWYGEKFYRDAAANKDPTGPSKGDWRVMRGGTWQYNTDWCRSAYRTAGFPSNDAYSHYGFRVIVKVPAKTQSSVGK
ncbi:MAG TPA: SUMF1/EgtB/PvdO family nonheme iron enzyme, partial [Gemmataceae bacterium]|nr:SUMF1/EgtB/PvdO family nonheme iron enzyme [Gemmataceae bacterium]